MRGNAELALVRNVYCLAAVVVLASTLVGSASGSCLSYGHSCWGAHGKRSGGGLRPIEAAGDVGVQNIRLPPLDERWLLSRLVNRQLMQVPLAAKLRAARILDEDSTMMDKIERNAELKDLAKSENQDVPDNLLMPDERELSDHENDQAIRAGFFKILRNID